MRAFISYSHEDHAALDRLHTHLAPLRSEGLIDAWFDRQILAGGDTDAEIDRELESCGLFLMLVSPDFLASDYCVNREMKRALERHRDAEARVVPIIVDPCDWFSTPLHELKRCRVTANPSASGRTKTAPILMSSKNSGVFSKIVEPLGMVQNALSSLEGLWRCSPWLPLIGYSETSTR